MIRGPWEVLADLTVGLGVWLQKAIATLVVLVIVMPSEGLCGIFDYLTNGHVSRVVDALDVWTGK